MRVCVSWGSSLVRRVVIRDVGRSFSIILAQRVDGWEDNSANGLDDVLTGVLKALETNREWLHVAHEASIKQKEHYSIIVISVSAVEWTSIACGQISGGIDTPDGTLSLDGGLLNHAGQEFLQSVVGGDVTGAQRLGGAQLGTVTVEFASKFLRDRPGRRDTLVLEVPFRFD